MNFLHLKYALEIAKTKSISKAAENLFIVQPNLSRAIKELETTFDITIFNRTPRGITITPEGEEFLQYAHKIVSQVEELDDLYSNKHRPKQRFSACVPRSCYISYAFSEFCKTINPKMPVEFYYKETNSMRSTLNVSKGECDLAIIRYQDTFDKYFQSMFVEKRFNAITLNEFEYVLLISKDNPLAFKEKIKLSDLENFVEVSHADPCVPSLPLTDIKKEELSEVTDKHIFVYERGSQFSILENVDNSYMWVSPMPQELCDKYNLVQRHCKENNKKYCDVLVYREGYKLTDLDEKFIDEVKKAKKKYIDNFAEKLGGNKNDSKTVY